ncbi:MAG TPA: cytochrome c oxidase subunit 3 [Bryobacteraceae bacterium]|nr:cytochrome c oxidase subunit 3 [Bryobacteraceae bacterium]
MATVTQPSIGTPPPVIPRPPRGHGGNGGNDGRGGDSSGRAARLAIFVGMVASTMTFIALVSAMFVRRHLSTNHDWHRMPIPPLLWWNTVALVLSSVAIDLGRRAFRAGSRPRFRLYWLTGTALGTWFLIGQAINWRFLVDHGFYMQHNPASAFFYILTMAHAAHVVGALAALIYVSCRTMFFPAIPLNRTVMEVSAIFWHFLDVMWLFLMAVFAFWI